MKNNSLAFKLIVVLLLFSNLFYQMVSAKHFDLKVQEIEGVLVDCTNTLKKLYDYNSQLIDTTNYDINVTKSADICVSTGYKELADSELTAIANVVSLEARGESYKGQCLVAQVIKNRAELWGKTPIEIITAKGQFATGTAPITESVYKAVCDVFIKGYKVVDEPITHFHTTSINPYWAKNKVAVITEGNHIFYK